MGCGECKEKDVMVMINWSALDNYLHLNAAYLLYQEVMFYALKKIILKL